MVLFKGATLVQLRRKVDKLENVWLNQEDERAPLGPWVWCAPQICGCGVALGLHTPLLQIFEVAPFRRSGARGSRLLLGGGGGKTQRSAGTQTTRRKGGQPWDWNRTRR